MEKFFEVGDTVKLEGRITETDNHGNARIEGSGWRSLNQFELVKKAERPIKVGDKFRVRGTSFIREVLAITEDYIVSLSTSGPPPIVEERYLFKARCDAI